MTGLAQFLVVVTSLAPIALVYAATLVSSDWNLACAWFAAALLLWLFCLALLRGGKRFGPLVTRKISGVTALDKEPLAFLVAYALPIVTRPPNHWGLAVFVFLAGVVIWQQRLFFMNPLLGFMGWRFYSCKDSDDMPVLIVTRNSKQPAPGNLQVQQLSDYLWLLSS